MRTYGQYCPIARASEIFAERWTPIILRNILHGGTTFTEIANGAPGIPRSLLTSRLRELARAGVIEMRANPSARGHRYYPTEAGRDLADVMAAMGRWGERWIELAPEHLDPGMVLHSWVSWYLERDRLPQRRVVVRFEVAGIPNRAHLLWVIFDGDASEVCLTDPGFEEDLQVHADARALAEWHLGRVEWATAVLQDRIHVDGSPSLARALPSWNRRSEAARAHRVVRRDPSPRRSAGRTPARVG